MSKMPLSDRKIDVTLLAIEMTQQAQHIKRCWSILKQLQQARQDYPAEIRISLGFYRSVYDSLVLSVFIGLGRLYDTDTDTYSLTTLHNLLGTSVEVEQYRSELKKLSREKKRLSTQADNLRKWRNMKFAHNDMDLAWDTAKLDNAWPMTNEDIEALIDFACRYCDFFATVSIGEPITDYLPACTDLENTLQGLQAFSHSEQSNDKSKLMTQ